MRFNMGRARSTALELVASIVNGRTVILTGAASKGVRMADFLADAGARIVRADMAIASTETRDQFMTYEQLLFQPTPELQTQLDSLDPDRTALVYAGSFASAQTLCSRRVIGARAPRHLDAERKDTQWELLGAPGVMIAVDELENLAGEVIVQGIPSRGVSMATSHTYLVPGVADSASRQELALRLKSDCTQAILTKLDIGTPCTFYGFITDTMIVDFGPVEALVSWDPLTWRIHASGILRPVFLTEHALSLARAQVYALAQRLRERYGYLGAFGTDGVLTLTGYVIHEINPRVCAGFGLMDDLAAEAAPLASIDLILREMPEASHALAGPLETIGAALAKDNRRVYQLWDGSEHDELQASGTRFTDWAARVRATAARGRVPLQPTKGSHL
jgi:hypothetical protein